MAVDEGYTYSDFYALTQIIGCTVVGGCIIGLFIIHISKSVNFVKKQKKGVKRQPQTTEEAERIRKVSHLFTVLTLFTYVLHAIFFSLDTYGVWANFSCNFSKRGSAFIYHVSKVFLYSTLATRLMVGFIESSFRRGIQITARTVYVLAFILLCIGLWFDCIDSVLYGSEVVSRPNLNLHWCALSEIPLWGVLLTLSFDVTLSTICLVAFMYPLRQLVITTQRIDDKILLLLQRYTILTFVALFTSAFCLMLINYFHLSWLLFIDNLINGLCIVCMSSFYNSWYNTLCFCQKWKCCMCGIVLTRQLKRDKSKLGLEPSKTGSKTGSKGEDTHNSIVSGTGTQTNTNTTQLAVGTQSNESINNNSNNNTTNNNNEAANNKGTDASKLIRYQQTVDMITGVEVGSRETLVSKNGVNNSKNKNKNKEMETISTPSVMTPDSVDESVPAQFPTMTQMVASVSSNGETDNEDSNVGRKGK